MALRDYPELLRPFVFHGVNVSYEKGVEEVPATCFLCGKEDHMHINIERGVWSCKRCLEEGNTYTFLQKLHAASAEQEEHPTTEILAEAKSLSLTTLQEWGVVDSILTGDPLIPGYNLDGKLATLSRVAVKENKWQVLTTPGTKRHPFGWHLLNGQSEVYLCEGPWDAMALYEGFKTHRKLRNGKIVRATDDKSLLSHAGVIGLSGTGGWSDDLIQALPERLTIAFDNDHPKRRGQRTIQPGWDGAINLAKSISKNEDPPKLYALDWSRGLPQETPDTHTYNQDLPDGYDLADLFSDYRPADAIKEVLAMRTSKFVSRDGSFHYPPAKKKKSKKKDGSPEEPPPLTPLECTSFDHLCKVYAQHLHFPKRLKDTLAIMLSSIVSVKLGGIQVWFRIIGPPGSGKSTLAEALAADREHVFPISHFTGLHSGYIEPGASHTDEDNSLIVKMHGRATFVKDADTLLSNQQRNTILSEFRDVFDGTSRAHYRNKVTHEYEDIQTSLVLCGTDDLRSLNRSTLGERFLDFDILGKHNGESYVDRTLRNTMLEVSKSFAQPEDVPEGETVGMEVLKRTTMGYIYYLVDQIPHTLAPEVSAATSERIKALAQIVSLLRTRPKDHREEQAYRIRPELPTRLSAQLKKLAFCLAYTINRKEVDKRVVTILKEVALDTSEGYQLELATLLYRIRAGSSSDDLATELRLSKSLVSRQLDHLRQLGVAESEKRRNGHTAGRKYDHWTLSPDFRDLYRTALR